MTGSIVTVVVALPRQGRRTWWAGVASRSTLPVVGREGGVIATHAELKFTVSALVVTPLRVNV